MNEVTIKNKEKATMAIREYRKSLLKEFLLVAESLKKKISNLYQNGIDEDEFICLENAATEQYMGYTILNSERVYEFLNILNKMNEENAIELFTDCIDTYDDLYCYEEWYEMEELKIAVINADGAEDYIID